MMPTVLYKNCCILYCFFSISNSNLKCHNLPTSKTYDFSCPTSSGYRPPTTPGLCHLAMVAVDVASKPTLASYNIRPDNFDPKRPGPPNKLQRAKDRDEAILGFGN